jgi:aminodeoxyfutalosine synthase
MFQNQRVDVNYVEDALNRTMDAAIQRVGNKLLNRERLDVDDGIACFRTSDLVGLGRMAFAVRRAIHGNQASFVANHHLNYTNVCQNQCRFCAFFRSQDVSDAYTLTPEAAARQIAESPVADLKEVHLVGGCHPELGLDYYVDLVRALSHARPGLKLKAFTAVEIDHISQKAGISHEACLSTLKSAGLEALPGGGAEVFSERVHRALFPRKIGAEQWLDIHGKAHALGIKTNATLLFGHIETLEERVRHLMKLRDQQDRSRGFQAFIALPFHPENTSLAHLPGPTGVDILKALSTARLILDNFRHIKAYWVMLGEKLAQTALHFGADDLEGTIVRERIAHQAGARTEAGLTLNRLTRLIREAGFEPVERDTFHQPVPGPAVAGPPARNGVCRISGTGSTGVMG